jgi:hypothetical protein
MNDSHKKAITPASDNSATSHAQRWSMAGAWPKRGQCCWRQRISRGASSKSNGPHVTTVCRKLPAHQPCQAWNAPSADKSL